MSRSGAEFERLAEGHFEDAVVAAEAMLIEPGGGGRGERELVAGDVVGVGVGDEGARLTTADVDARARRAVRNRPLSKWNMGGESRGSRVES